MALSAVVTAALAGRIVRAALLCEFFFVSSTERTWPGHYELTADGKTWRGLGVMLTVDGLRTRADLAAEVLTFKMSGVDAALVTIAKNSATEVPNQPCNVYLQFFDEAWAPLDDPILLKSAEMDVMSYVTTGPSKRDISLTAESIFVARNFAPYAYYTDRDQNKRVTGDRGLELVGTLNFKVVTWPDY